MNRTDAPTKQPKPFGINGPREPILATTPAGDNTASYDVGFPSITMTLKSAGGLPPKGQDMNQILYELSSLSRWFSAGAFNTFDATFSTAIGGYPSGSVVISDNGSKLYVNRIDSNTSNPNASGAGWVDFVGYLGLTYYADKKSLATQEFDGPVSSKDSLTATSSDGVTRKVSLNASTGLQIVTYDGGTYKGAINIPTKDGTMALVSDLANFADKKTSDSQVFTAPVVSNDSIVAQSGGSKVILSAQNGLKLITYQNNQYAGGVEVPKRDGVIALTADLFGVSQTWQNVKGSRSAGVTYTNSTGRTIAVSIAGILASNMTGVQLSLAVGGVEASSFALTQSSFDIRGNVFAIVPPGATYNLTAANVTSILTWSELR